MKDIFIIGALFGVITKTAIDFYDGPVPDNVLNEFDTLIIDFMANRFNNSL